MGAIKELQEKLCESFPSTCPKCEAELVGYINWDNLNEAIAEIERIAGSWESLPPHLQLSEKGRRLNRIKHMANVPRKEGNG